MSVQNASVIQIAPGLAIAIDPEIWETENFLMLSSIGENVQLQIDLRIKDILAETSQRVEGIAILRSA